MADRQNSEQYPEMWETNLKIIVDKLEQLAAHGADQSQQESVERHSGNLGERQTLFENLVSQQAQLFNQALQAQAKLTDLSVQAMARATHNGLSIDVKELDPDVAEVAESAIMTEILDRLQALEVSVKD